MRGTDLEHEVRSLVTSKNINVENKPLIGSITLSPFIMIMRDRDSEWLARAFRHFPFDIHYH
jgi:hypothetical protein